GDHEGKDAPSWIAGSDGDGGSGDVVLCSVHIFICFGLLCPFTKKRGDVRGPSGSGLQRAPLVPAPAPKPRGEGQRDWNKNEHDNPNNSVAGPTEQKRHAILR